MWLMIKSKQIGNCTLWKYEEEEAPHSPTQSEKNIVWHSKSILNQECKGSWPPEQTNSIVKNEGNEPLKAQISHTHVVNNQHEQN